MSEVLVGSAYSVFDLRYQGFTQGVSAVMAQLQQLRAAAAQPIVATVTAGASGGGGGGGSGSTALTVRQSADDTKAAEQATLRYASSLAQAQKAQGDLTGAATTYRTALASLTPNTIEYNAALGRLATTESQLARAQQGPAVTALDQVKSGLLGIIGPAALVTAGFAAVSKAINITEESFKLKASLDQTNASIAVQLRSFRDVNTTMDQARAFAARYALTQAETNEAIQASIPILRQSKASADEVMGTLLRLSVLKPEQGISGAAFALAELQGGQARSLETRFNIPIAKANELKAEIAKGGDAVAVLGRYLESVGVGMDALAVRTQGAAGKMNELKVETEAFQLALAGQAGGPGLALLDERIALTRGATRLLSGDTQTMGQSIVAAAAQGTASFQTLAKALGLPTDALIGLAKIQVEYRARQEAATAADQQSIQVKEAKAAVDDLAVIATTRQTGAMDDERRAVGELQALTGVAATDIQRSAEASLLDAANKQSQAQATALLRDQTDGAVQSFLALNPNIDAAGVAALIAAGKIDPLIGKLALLQQQTAATSQQLLQFNLAQGVGSLAPKPTGLGGDVQTAVAGLAGGGAKIANQIFGEANKVADAQFQLRLAQATTNAQKIAIIREQEARTTDQAEKLRFEAQIAGIQTSAAKAAGTAASKGLSALDKSTIDLAGQGLKDYQAQLDLVNQKLAAGNLTALQRNQLIKDQLTLQQKITDEQTKQQDSALSAAASAIQNRQAQRTEVRQLTFLDRMAGAGGERGAEASDEAALIRIRAEQRTRSLNREITAAGGAVPTLGTRAGTAAMPIGGATPLLQPGGAAGGAANGVNLNITLEVGGDVFASATLRNVQSGARVALRSNQAAGA